MVRGEIRSKRDNLVAKVRSIVRRATRSDQEEWDVEAVSPFLENAPLELVVVVSHRYVSAKEADQQRRTGKDLTVYLLSTETILCPLCMIMSAFKLIICSSSVWMLIRFEWHSRKLAKLLADHGFTGSFVPHPSTPIPQFPRQHIDQSTSQSPQYSWPAYHPPHNSEPTYPPTLFSTHNDIPFYITPASPFHRLHQKILQEFGELEGVASVAGELVGLVWLWMRSHGVTDMQLEMRTVVWMVFSFLRVLPTLFSRMMRQLIYIYVSIKSSSPTCSIPVLKHETGTMAQRRSWKYGIVEIHLKPYTAM